MSAPTEGGVAQLWVAEQREGVFFFLARSVPVLLSAAGRPTASALASFRSQS